MNSWMIAWSDFNGTASIPGIVDTITAELTAANLLGILAGLAGVTIGFTLIYRFAARIKNTIVGAMTNSSRRRRG